MIPLIFLPFLLMKRDRPPAYNYMSYKSDKTGETRPQGHCPKGYRPQGHGSNGYRPQGHRPHGLKRPQQKKGKKIQDKVWVLVELTPGHNVYARRRRVNPDTAGTFVSLIQARDLDTLERMPHPQPGYFGATHHFRTRVHSEGENFLRESSRVPLSKAEPPEVLNQIVLDRIRLDPSKVFLGPAYPVEENANLVNDTQICVSGGIEDDESPEDAAMRELEEEIGMVSDGDFQYVSWTFLDGRNHHLFYVRV